MSEFTLTYNGTVGPINTKLGSPGQNFEVTSTPVGFTIKDYSGSDKNLGDIQINWSTSNVPSQIQNSTYNSLISQTFSGSPLFNVNSKTSISFKGYQCFDGGSTPQTKITMQGQDNQGTFLFLTANYKQPGSGFGSCTSVYSTNVNYNVTDTNSYQEIANPITLIISATNICSDEFPACVDHTMYLSEFFITLNITATISCGGLNLETPICVNYCNFNTDQRSQCIQPYIDYCFKTLPVTDKPQIEESINCQDFFKNYNSDPGPDSRIDTAMNLYCKSEYNLDFNKVIDSKNPVDIDMCSCHMPEIFYDNYVKEVIKLYPNFGKYINNFGINPKCLFSKCAGSPYKTSDIGKICALPQCINIASFINGGTFNGSSANITQSSNCANIKNGDFGGGDGGGFPEEAKTWIEKHWVWLVLGISILVILIIVILIVLAGEGNKKNKKKKR